MKVLITGGAGYIGSHAVLSFLDAGHPVVVLDDLSTGNRALVPPPVHFVKGDVGDRDLVRSLLAEEAVEAVVHFAGSVVVPESVANPLKYYGNNSSASRSLIESCVEAGVRAFLFSSTAAVYGSPDVIPVKEDAPVAPVNPYGWSKLMTEQVLKDTAAAHDFTYAALRYFNVAGADPEGRTGQSTPNATHLIKIASEVAIGRRPFMEIYGEDYDTPDGTCIRDYIHVSDLARAHVAALAHLVSSGANAIFNCGYGHGFSVREVLRSVAEVAAVDLDVRAAPRRPGDPAALVADSARIQSLLGWRPEHDDLAFIVRTAIDWERQRAGLDVAAASAS